SVWTPPKPANRQTATTYPGDCPPPHSLPVWGTTASYPAPFRVRGPFLQALRPGGRSGCPQTLEDEADVGPGCPVLGTEYWYWVLGTGYRVLTLQTPRNRVDTTIGMPDLSRILEYAIYALPVVGIAAVVWAWRITAQGREREREVKRLSEEAHTIKNDFVAMVSHELRTPLTSIAGFSHTLVESWQDLPAEEVSEFLTIINRQAIYLGDLVEDVLV